MFLEVGLIGLFGIVVPLVLYLLIDEETSNPEIVDRSEAERLAQRRGGRPGRSQSEPDDETEEWGIDGEWGASEQGEHNNS
jgi:hypothetical protein